MTTVNSSTDFTNTIMPVIVAGAGQAFSFPMTDSQAEIWLASKQGDEANCAFNEITTLILKGSVNLRALKNAWKLLALRHESLRARFSSDRREMIVGDKPAFEWQEFDFSELSPKDRSHEQLKLLQDQACTPFDLESGPLFRLMFQKFSDGEFYLTITAHHIVLDGWSFGLLIRDLGHLYDQEIGLSTEPLPPVSSYREYSELMAQYSNSEQGTRDEQFWTEMFEDAAPVLDLPIENDRPQLRSYFARRHDHFIPGDVVEGIRKLGAKSGCSLFNTMLAAFQCYVARIAGTQDFCVGIPTAGQLAMERPELVGHCVNMMPLRSQVELNQNFIEQLKKTRSSFLDAIEHERFTFGNVLAQIKFPRDPSRVPLMPISFNLDPVADADQKGFEGLDIEVRVEPRTFENLEWFINGVIHQDKSVELQVQYNTDLFTADKIESLFEGFQCFVEQLVESPEAKLSKHSVLTRNQQQKMLVQWNDTERTFPIDSTLHSETSKQAQRNPGKVAVKFQERELTYRELDQRSNQVARFLKANGATAGDLVGICVPRDEQMVVLVLGILKSGAGYVPLDPAFPQERLQYMCDHSQLTLVLGSSSVKELVSSFGKPTLLFEEVEADISSCDENPLDIENSAQSTCYVIYTSGSTGKPKGVEVPHGAVVNFLYSMAEKPGFGPDDNVLAVTTLSFDIAVLELYLPLIVGGTTVIASKETTTDGQRIVDAINENRITVFQSTPASLRLMIAAGWCGHDGLKVLCGGEPMPTDLVGPLLERCAELWNMYGPTETTVWSSAFQITDANAKILIGKPIANTQIYILDPQHQPVPVGGEGEIFIGGAGVTLGYLHQNEMTQERFVHNPYFNPFIEYCNHRLYRTGDIGRFRVDGNIEFLRRNDKQVKVRGFRIELGEIESAIKSIQSIHQAVVIVREDKPGDLRLVAYCVNNAGFEFSANEVRDSLRDVLPYYMVPQHFVALESLPQTSNGKIDLKSLPAPTVANHDDSNELKPGTAVQRFVARVWSDILEIDDILLNDNFFDLGGHSLLVMKAITSIEEKTGARLSPPDFLVGTLEQLAEKVNQQAEVTDDANYAPAAQTRDDVEGESVLKESISTTEQAPAKGGVFSKLKGFWD